MERHFLGWNKPFLTVAVEWLWERRENFSRMLLVVPTMESGRKLRQALAEVGPCLAPEVMTAGRYSALGYLGTEQPLLELLVWQSVVEDFNWEDATIPQPEGDFWAEKLAQQLISLRQQTGEYGMELQDVKNRIGQSHPDASRWGLLARWEFTYKQRLARHDQEDSFSIRNNYRQEAQLPTGVDQVVWVGVTDPTQHAREVASTFQNRGIAHIALIAAPESSADGFDELGVPVTSYWSEESIDWPGGEGAIFAATEPHAQVQVLLEKLGEVRAQSDLSVALGVGEKGDVSLMQSRFLDAGVKLYNPAGSLLSEWSFTRWYRTWKEFNATQKVSDLLVLTRSPWTQKLLTGWEVTPVELTKALERVCNVAKPHVVNDLWHLRKENWLFDERQHFTDELNVVIDFLSSLKPALDLSRKSIGIDRVEQFLVMVLGQEESEEAYAAERVFNDLAQEVSVLSEKLVKKLDLGREFLSRLEATSVGEAREGVHLEALGWLELAFEQSPNLFITGLNEGVIPNTEIGDAWMPESLRKLLGMKMNADRFAHDVYYLKSLCESRREVGAAYGFFNKFGASGDPLSPSRLLMQVAIEDLPARVKHCFSGSCASISGYPWTRDWALLVHPKAYNKGLSATKISDYLKCPFRFYLKYVMGMDKPKENYYEWDSMEFGLLTHLILERMGLDEYASKVTDPHSLHNWLTQCLDEIVEKRFSGDMPLAFKIQRESLVQRLGFFAREEVAQRKADENWKVSECEEKFSLRIDDVTITGMIDRVDVSSGGQFRLIDYKTGKVDDARKSHIKALGNKQLPEHLAGSAVEFSDNGKPAYWENLQLPIYALAYMEKTGKIPELAYCTVAESADATKYTTWEFTQEEADSARAALRDIISAIKEQRFWPPAEKIEYDDLEPLAFGRPLAEGIMFDEEVAQ